MAKRKNQKTIDYSVKKAAAAAISRELSLSGRDIGELPAIANPVRRKQTHDEFRYFCEAYFKSSFPLAWSDDHLKVIAKVEQAVLHGGLFALAMPRGSGKTTLAECACLWALLNGHKSFVCLIGASAEHACEMLNSIKSELENNELLAADFPEVCIPIQKLEGIASRCNGQLYNGERTHIGWSEGEAILPTIALPDTKAWKPWRRIDGTSFACGAAIKVAGITGRIRGMKLKRIDGAAVRPDFVILDDPQTDESAMSVSQSAHRERILSGAVLGLAGPGKKISGVMPCTVISPGDMADNILDRKKHPDWNGERTKMVYAFPANQKLWDKYHELRAESFRLHGDGRLATAFYAANRAAMDEGAIIAWPARFNPDELSAVQHAMNLLQDRGREAFFAEYQNKPLAIQLENEEKIMSADEIAAKLNGHDRSALPLDVTHITMFVDIHQTLLYWMMCGWGDGFTGYVIDYGTYPEQTRSMFTLKEATRTLQHVSKSSGMEACVYAGLETLVNSKLGIEYRRVDGAMLRVNQCMIDANWGDSTDVVYRFCRQSNHASQLLPSHGRGVGASRKPFSDYRPEIGVRAGLNWRIPLTVGKRAIRHCIFDTNFWKSFVHARLFVRMGDRGCLSLFGRNQTAHRLLAEHLTAEYRVRTAGLGRVCDEWKQHVNRDNHWLDCLVGCAVAASLHGISLSDVGGSNTAKPRRKSYSAADLAKAYGRG